MSFEAYLSHSHVSKLHNSIHDGLIEDYNLLPTSIDFLEKVFLPKLLYLGYFKPSPVGFNLTSLHSHS